MADDPLTLGILIGIGVAATLVIGIGVGWYVLSNTQTAPAQVQNEEVWTWSDRYGNLRTLEMHRNIKENANTGSPSE